MRYYRDSGTEMSVEVPDDTPSALAALYAGRLAANGYYPIIATIPAAEDDSFFLDVVRRYDPIYENGVQTGWHETLSHVPAKVRFDAAKLLSALSRSDSKDSNDSCSSGDSGGLDPYSAICSLGGDAAFMDWLVFSHEYVRGEENSEKLVACIGDRAVVEDAIRSAM